MVAPDASFCCCNRLNNALVLLLLLQLLPTLIPRSMLLGGDGDFITDEFIFFYFGGLLCLPLSLVLSLACCLSKVLCDKNRDVRKNLKFDDRLREKNYHLSPACCDGDGEASRSRFEAMYCTVFDFVRRQENSNTKKPLVCYGLFFSSFLLS